MGEFNPILQKGKENPQGAQRRKEPAPSQSSWTLTRTLLLQSGKLRLREPGEATGSLPTAD